MKYKLFFGLISLALFAAAPAAAQTMELSASPTSGDAPLTVSFSTGLLSVANSYTINFGDGQSAAPTQGSCVGITATQNGSGGVECTYSSSHTYQSAGTYTAILYQLPSGVYNCPNGGCTGTEIGATTVTVSGGSQTGGALGATPTSGSAPLSVSFNAQGLTSGQSYTITFGDGSSGQLSVAYPPCAYGTPCSPVGSASHTYQSNGTYTAQLTTQSSCSGTGCAASIQLLGTITITVTGSTQNTSFIAYPASGQAPLVVTFTPNSSVGIYAVNFGDGTSASLQQGAISHTYNQTGTYIASFTSDAACLHSNPSCEIAQQSYGSLTVTVSGGSQTGGALGATPTSGSAPLSVNFWYDLNGGSTNGYSISFGDGTSGSLSVGCGGNPYSGVGACPQALVTSHTYTSPGTYIASISQNSSCSNGYYLGTTCPPLSTAAIAVSGSGTTCPSRYTAYYGQCIYYTQPTTVGPTYIPSTQTVPTPYAFSCPVLTTSLYRGMSDGVSNGPVIQLQAFLATIFNLNPTTVETGYFGPITQSYVEQFQSKNGISPIGTVGPLTRGAIARTCASL